MFADVFLAVSIIEISNVPDRYGFPVINVGGVYILEIRFCCVQLELRHMNLEGTYVLA